MQHIEQIFNIYEYKSGTTCKKDKITVFKVENSFISWPSKSSKAVATQNITEPLMTKCFVQLSEIMA